MFAILSLTDHYVASSTNLQNHYTNSQLVVSQHNYFFFNQNLKFKNQPFIIKSLILPILFIKYLAISFTGKGYRLVFNDRKVTTFNFGHSHLYYVYFFSLKVVRITKLKLMFFGISSFYIKPQLKNLYNVKPINIFTWRGVRFRKQALRKKIGKSSMYM